jgi:hypothetical protein
MKIRVAFLAAIAVFTAACSSMPEKSGSSAAPAAAAAPKGPTLAGEWVLTTESQMGAQDSQMTVKQTGSAIEGSLVSQLGTVPFTGTVTGSAVNFSFNINAQGTDLKLDYAGTVEGDTMKGKAVFGSFGEGTFHAKKK